MNFTSSARAAAVTLSIPFFLAACEHGDSNGAAKPAATSFNLSPLAQAGGAQDWATIQGNAGHTGFVPITVDPAAINKRWSLAISLQGDIATGDGKVYVPMPDARLLALNETDGSTAWTISLSKSPVNPAAFVDGKLFLISGEADTYFHSVSAATGAILSTAYLPSQAGEYMAPTVHGGSVYAACGHDAALCSFSPQKGTRNYMQAVSGAPQPWSVAATDSSLYYYNSKKLHVANPANGNQRFAIEDTGSGAPGTAENTVPVVGGDALVFAMGAGNDDSNAITAFDTAARSVRWRAEGMFAASPAYAGGTVYILNSGTRALEARNAASGKVVWSWPLPAGEEFAMDAQLSANLVVTNNLVFVSGTQKTYAVDRDAHNTAWHTAAVGKLAISRNGILYIRDHDQILAVNLK